MISEFRKYVLCLEREFNELKKANALLHSALEDIAKDYDPKQTWVTVAVERRLIARRALDEFDKRYGQSELQSTATDNSPSET